MDSLIQKVKSCVNVAEIVERYGGVKLNSNHQCCCPLHSEKTPSFSVREKEQDWHCFGCGEGGDAIDFVAKILNLTVIEAAHRIAEDYRITVGDSKPSAKSSITDYIKRCLADIGKTNYFEKRGLSKATIRKFCLGYDEYRKAVVIPYSGKMTYYQTRGTQDEVFFKPKTEDAGAEPLFNIEALRLRSKEPIFVVESPICAMSIYQSGGNAISTCGTAGWRKVVDEVKRKKPLGGFILCMDNDEPGRKASRTLFDELTALGVQVIEFNVAGDCKDPNELLVQNPKKLEDRVQAAKIALRKKYATAKDSFDALELQGENVEPPTWIVNDVLPTGLAILCAPSKLGKSWMMLQMCLAVAEGKEFLDFKTNKCGCLYYALEDSKARLKDRMNKILKGRVAPTDVHFVIRADTVDNGLLDKITEELRSFPNIKLVVIDTLQKVRSKAVKNESLYSVDYREMAQLKDFADKNKICLLFVHHLRKLADESDVFNMISGSTALMGAADSIFIISKKKRKDENATLSMTGRDIQQNDLVIAFNKLDYVWEVEGTAEEIEARRERREYEGSPIIQTIKELVKRNPISGWCGSAQDLMKAVYDVTGKQISESPSGVGKLISKYEYRLHCDDIEHKASKSNTRSHSFKKIIRGIPYGYQRTIYEKDDE